MNTLCSVVLWRDEPFSQIRELVESSLCIVKVSRRLGLAVSHRIILCAIQSNVTEPSVQEWASSFEMACADLGTIISPAGFDRAYAEFRLVACDPSRAISLDLDNVLAFALPDMMMGSGISAILYDLPLDDRLAEWILNTLLPVNWLEYCLVSVRSQRPNQVRLAYITSTDAYIKRGLLSFDSYLRSHGWFKKSTYGVNNLDDLAFGMEQSAKKNKWKVKPLRLPSKEP